MDDTELGQLAGSVTMVGFRGTAAPPDSIIARQLRDLHLAGVILFDRDAVTKAHGRNIASPAQLAELTRQLRAVTPDLLIAVDQEGGAVARLAATNGHPDFPSHRELGQQDDPANSAGVAGEIAEACRAAGLNVNFAPCVDLALDPHNPIIALQGRSFSADPQVVLRHAGAFIAAHRRRGVLTAIKHFPGHGSTRDDTHLQAVDITETFDPAELEPYRAMIADGAVDLVMVGHLSHRGWDPEHPASLSRPIIDGLLRERLGFDGVVVTDCLDMTAISGHYELDRVVTLALNAGVDLLLFGNNNERHAEGKARDVVEAVVGAVRAGAVSESCLREHAERVQRLRAALGGA